jgi:GT2 family glycosyltransferase
MSVKLSIIIVSYKVPVFLRQCLFSLEKATEQLKKEYAWESEIIVADNKSEDESAEMVKALFPKIRLFENTENIGFSRANNFAFSQSSGQYVLFINPDTLVPEDLFTSILPYMDEHPKTGALGVKMTDADGRFQPESKRAYPTPMRAFGKVFGLNRLFPNSKKLNGYLLNKLNPNEIHKIEILSGAFMLIRREAAEQTGLFDERFFMYGEDIDLSYRLLKAGYENVYYGPKSIIHYKGESTKINTHRYITIFYEAMQIFIDKHTGSKNKIAAYLLKTAVYMRASMAHATLNIKKITGLLPTGTKKNTPGDQILIIGDSNDVKSIRKLFCEQKKKCFIQAVFNPPETDSAESTCQTILQISQKVKIETLIFNIDKQKASLFLCITEKLAGKGMHFYTISNQGKQLIGRDFRSSKTELNETELSQ